MASGAKPLDQDQAQIIIRALTERRVTGCPMCKENKFALAEGYFVHQVQKQLAGGLVLGGPTIPTVAIICTQCGFVSQHALGALGLLNQPAPEKSS